MNLFNSIRKSKLFTLIELIVVIVVLGILAAIVVPNISSFKEEADEKAIVSNIRNLQTSVDMYALKNNGEVPTKDRPDLGKPQTLEYFVLIPDFLRDKPKTTSAKYWVDENQNVWGSTADSPQDVIYNNNELTWKPSEGAVSYQVFELDKNTKGKASKTRLKIVKEVLNGDTKVNLPKLESDSYFVSSIDKYNLPSPPVLSGYKGYTEPNKDLTIEAIKINRTNGIPQAILKVIPETGINEFTTLQWDTSLSSDPNSDPIIEKEWKLNGTTVNELPSNLSEGNHTVSLRVKDSKNAWSEWTERIVSVSQAPRILVKDLPIGAVIYDDTWKWEFRTGQKYSGTGPIKPVEWIVVSKNHYQTNSVTLLTKEKLALYHIDDRGQYGYNDWLTSNGARPFLNTTFYNTFSSSFKAKVLKTSGYDLSNDYVFIPSAREFGATFGNGVPYPYFNTDGNAKRSLGMYYYNRTVSTVQTNFLSVVNPDGSINQNTGTAPNGYHYLIRPALNITSDMKVVEVSPNLYKIVYS